MDGETVLLRPATHLRPRQLDPQAAVDFAGREAVGGWRTGGEQFAEQVGDGGNPLRVTITSGSAGRPLGLAPLRTGAQVVVVELVTTATGDLELLGHRGHRELVGAQLRQQVADEGDAVAVD